MTKLNQLKAFIYKNKKALRFAVGLLLLILLLPFCLGITYLGCPAAVSFTAKADTVNYTKEELSDAFTAIDSAEDTAYILYDMERGQILLSKDSTKTVDASLLTRMMACLIVLENHELTDKITAPETTVSSDGNFVLTAGTTYTVNSLVSTALAGGAENSLFLLVENTAFNGNEAKTFVERMNEKALLFGMTGTFFTNIDGSVNTLQKTTVYDTALFIKNALANTKFQGIYCSPMAVSWDGVIIDNPNNLVIENTTSTLGGSYGSFSSDPSKAAVTYYKKTATENMPDFRKLTLVASGVTVENYLVSQKAILDKFTSEHSKVLYCKKGDIMAQIPLGSEQIDLRVDRDIYFYAPITDSEFVENISYAYDEGYSPDIIKAPVKEGTRICTVRYRLKDGTTCDAVLHSNNTIVTSRQTVNHIYELLQNYSELFLGIVILLIIVMAISLNKIYWHFALRK